MFVIMIMIENPVNLTRNKHFEMKAFNSIRLFFPNTASHGYSPLLIRSSKICCQVPYSAAQ